MVMYGIDNAISSYLKIIKIFILYNHFTRIVKFEKGGQLQRGRGVGPVFKKGMVMYKGLSPSA